VAKAKRLVVIADLHSGHRVGLTPPSYQWHVNRGSERIWNKCAKIQRECWTWYAKTIENLKPIDVLVVNGDAIDGRGERSGGVELITGDRREQADIAAECILKCGAKHIVMVRGTPYHTGNKEDWEDVVARLVRADKIGNHEWIDLNGVVFDFKHKVGGSSTPYGQFTAPAKEAIWNVLWADEHYQPKASWVIRSHVHYARICGGFREGSQWLAVTTPALQAMGTRYGARECSNIVDYGLLAWDISAEGRVEWLPKIARIKAQRSKTIVF